MDYFITMTANSSAVAPYVTELIGQSEAFLDFQDRLAYFAKVDRPVLLVGERGTGKELAAARLHLLSARWDGPFITLNCAALAESLLESELFGHETGAFTGAVTRRSGRFEMADKGTLFLDEIGNTPLSLQQKILRVVEYGVFERVGGEAPLSTDVRLIGATNLDLPDQVRQGLFLPDLLDRLSFEVLTLPPLRSRQGDIMLLAKHFVTRMALEIGLEKVPTLSAAAQEKLLSHDWPGNVRELKNVMERAVYRSRGGSIRDVVIDPFTSPYRPNPDTPSLSSAPQKTAAASEEQRPSLRIPLKQQVERLEVSLLSEALSRSRYNQKQAAKLLGLTYHQFRNLYRKHQTELHNQE